MKTIRFFSLFSLLILSACASSQPKTYELDKFYKTGQYSQVISQLQTKVKSSPSKDQILWELNLALAYQANGQYLESNQILLSIKEKIKWSDFTSLKTEALTLALNEKYKKFQLAEYEQFLIQVYITLNFALMNKWPSALVEMRSVDEALYNLKGINEHFNLVNHVHLSYLSGIIYEANKKYDEAFIDYERVLNSQGRMSYLPFDLVRTALLSGRQEKAKIYQDKFKVPAKYVSYVNSRAWQTQGEMIIVFQNGMAPHKVESKRWANLPDYQPRLKEVEQAEIFIDYESFGETVLLVDIEKFALELYEAQYKTILAKDVVRSSLKEATAWVVGAASGGFLGVVAARQLAHSTTEADLRSWFLLPKEIQIARIKVLPGSHRLQLNYNLDRGLVETKDILVKPNQFLLVPFKFGNSL